jgi:hypothetical protein
MKKIIYVVVFFFVQNISFAQAEWHYDIECAGVGVDGTYLVQVTSYGKNVQDAVVQAKKDAVHGVLFRGFIGKAGECMSQKPIITNSAIENEKKDFFDDFFSKNGQYMQYVSLSQANNCIPTKVGGSYRVVVILSVSKDILRKDMEAVGIVKSLSSGF